MLNDLSPPLRGAVRDIAAETCTIPDANEIEECAEVIAQMLDTANMVVGAELLCRANSTHEEYQKGGYENAIDVLLTAISDNTTSVHIKSLKADLMDFVH